MKLLSFPSPFGTLFVSFDQQWIYGLSWHTREIPQAINPQEDPIGSLAWEWLSLYCSGESPKTLPPIKLNGTPFQKRVWDALGGIPWGERVNYGFLAKRLKTSPRAVGNALGANPIPLMVPCHRVVAQAGLGGYSGGEGVSTKMALLSHERKFQGERGLA